MSVKIKIDGVAQVQKNLKQWGRKKDEESKKVLKEIGFKIQRDAKLTAREKGIFDTGRLISSISVNWSRGPNKGAVDAPAKRDDGIGRPDSKLGKFEVAVGTNVFYAPFQELGTRKMRARPFLFPSFFSHEGDVERKLKEIMKK